MLELELKMEEENVNHEDILKLTELYAVFNQIFLECYRILWKCMLE